MPSRNPPMSPVAVNAPWEQFRRCFPPSQFVPDFKKEKAMRLRPAAGLAVLVLLFAMSILAQNNTGIISGRVTDPSGAVVPNAQITVTQTETNVDAVSATNSEGLFRVPSLINGP